MLRKNCKTENLAQYYNDFLLNDVINPEVHPWIAESWRYSKENNISNENFFLQENVLLPTKMIEHPLHKNITEYIENFYRSAREIFEEYELRMILTDNKKNILKICNNNFLTTSSEEPFCGVCCSEEAIGTSSLAIAAKYGVPFMIFGSEMWQIELQSSDFISIPIFLDKNLLYILTFALPTGRNNFDFIYLTVWKMKYSLEEYLKLMMRIQAMDGVLDTIGATVYYIEPDSKVEYTNKRGAQQLGDKKKLSDLYINYRYIPIADGFEGKKTINEEQAWVTDIKLTNELTTIIPIKIPNVDEIVRVTSFSIPNEKLRELNAQVCNYDYRKSLERIPIKNPKLLKIREKAIALAKKKHTVLLEDEAGNALARLAYGMHQISPYANGNFINFCYSAEKAENHQNICEKLRGKLKVLNKGTLFINDIEKYSVAEGDCIADALKDYVAQNKVETFRLIVGASSNIKVLTTKGLFSRKFYNMLKKNVLKIIPLRERPEDVEVLAEFIVDELSDKLGLQVKKRLSPEAMKLIKGYFWPGNIMELVLVLEVAFFKAEGNIIYTENIELPKKSVYSKEWKKDKETFIENWKLSGGKITNMASMLGVSRITLYRYLHKFKLLEGEDA